MNFWRAALKGGPASCTLGRPAQQSEPKGCTKGCAAQGGPEGCTKRVGGLHIRAGCTTERAGGLHIRTGCTIGRAGGLHINTCRRTVLQPARPAGPPFSVIPLRAHHLWFFSNYCLFCCSHFSYILCYSFAYVSVFMKLSEIFLEKSQRQKADVYSCWS